MIRKLLYSALLVFAVQFCSYGQNTPYLDYLYVTDSCVGPNNNFPIMASAAIANYSAGLTIDFYWGDGTSSLNTTGSTFGSFFQSHNYALPGTYSIAAVLMDGNTAIDTIMKSINNICSMVWGDSYKRMDNNCTLDPGEPLISAPYSIEVKENGIPLDTFEVNGGISYRIPNASLTSVYSLNVISAPPGFIAACPTTPYTFQLDTINYYNPIHFDFGFDCDPNYTGFDLSMFGTGYFRPVANSYLYIQPRSSSCTVQPASVTLQLSPKYAFGNSVPAPTSVVGNTLTWDYPGLANTDFSSIFITLNPVGSLTLGDTVQNKVLISPTLGDNDTTNNLLLMVDSIKSSFDPNDKYVQPMGAISPGTNLTYTINFENLGNDTAFNIHILDTLSDKLNLESFKVLSSSANVTYQMFNTASGSVLRYNFKDILLPGTEDAPNNRGFVTYQINAKADLAEGTVIENTASIYFDINAAVVTNTTQNYIPIPQGITKNKGQMELNIYPNPAQDLLFIENPNWINEIKITNALGQVVLHQKIGKGITDISIKSWAKGLYFLQATGDKGHATQKFIKK